MNSVFGTLGVVGIAVVITIALVLGTKAGGKFKPLGWTPCLILGCLAGSAYNAAGGIFALVPDLLSEGIRLVQQIIPGLGMGAIALALVAFIGWKKLNTRQAAVMGIVFWYVASSAGGVWGTFAQAFVSLRDRIA